MSANEKLRERYRSDPLYREHRLALNRECRKRAKLKNPELFLEKDRERHKKRLLNPHNREKKNASNRKYTKAICTDPKKHAAHLSKTREYDRERYRTNSKVREKQKQRYKRNHKDRLSAYRREAKNDNRPFELTREEAYDLFDQECFYCGEPSRTEQLMGLDRFDNDQGYLVANVVPACWTCNNLKGPHSWVNVKMHLQAIFTCSILGNPDATTPFNPRGSDASIRKRIGWVRNNSPGYTVTLTDEEVTERFGSNCVYCNAIPNPSNGIDRVDNDKGYTLENAIACCTICNFMKGTTVKTSFLAHVKQMVVRDARINPFVF